MKSFIYTVLYQPFYNIFILLIALIPGHNVGLAIIVLTVLLRLALTPLKYKSLESQMKQKELQPEIKALQAKHKDDKQAQSMAMMQLYKDKGVNPASGCLPMLVQLPFLIVLFYVFKSGLGPENYHDLYSFIPRPATVNTAFLWLKDVTKVDHTFVLPVLAGISQFFYSRALMSSMPSSGDKNDMTEIMTKQMTYFAPVMTVLFARSLPAALSIYWIAGTLVDWYQQTHSTKRFLAKEGDNKNVTVSVRSRKKDAHD